MQFGYFHLCKMMNTYFLKKKIYTTTLIFLIATSAYSQTPDVISLGLRGGLILSNWAGSSVDNVAGENRLNPGINAGIFGTYSINENWGTTLELNYAQKGTKFSNSSRIKTGYLDIPLYVNYFFGQGGSKLRIKIFAGPYLGILLDAKDDTDGNTDVDVKDIFNTIDAGLLLGTGFHYKVSEIGDNWLIFDIRYGIGFTDIFQPNPLVKDITNRALSFNVGYSFPLNKK